MGGVSSQRVLCEIVFVLKLSRGVEDRQDDEQTNDERMNFKDLLLLKAVVFISLSCTFASNLCHFKLIKIKFN